MQTTILGSHSVVQRVFNFHVFRGWFEEEIHSQEDTQAFGQGVKNLRAAKHRFESFTTPLGRLILYLPAFLRTLHRIRVDRDRDAVAQAGYLFVLN